MEFALYEEFPTEENLSKLGLIDFPTDLILAARSLDEFGNIKEEARQLNSQIRNIGYWPTLSKEEGYWMSPFSDQKALERVMTEIENSHEHLTLHWDAEVPLLIDPKLMTKGIRDFTNKKKRITQFLRENAGINFDLITSEQPIPKALGRSLGVSFDSNTVNYSDRVVMFYTSFKKPFYRLGKRITDRVASGLLRAVAKKSLKKDGDRSAIGIGCLDGGIMGCLDRNILANEPRMSPEEFNEDLRIIQDVGINKAYVFRLGGLNQEFVNIMKSYRAGY